MTAERYCAAAGGLPGAFAGLLGVHLRRADLSAEYHLAGLGAHGRLQQPPMPSCAMALGFEAGNGQATLQVRSVQQVQAGSWSAPCLRVSDDGAECDRRADPSEGDAGDPDYRGGARRLDAGAVGRGESVTEAAAGRYAEDRGAGRGRPLPASRVARPWSLRVRAWAVAIGSWTIFGDAGSKIKLPPG
jgi:hypothetical protein